MLCVPNAHDNNGIAVCHMRAPDSVISLRNTQEPDHRADTSQMPRKAQQTH